MIRLDPLGLLDILSATLILMTASALPESFLHFHAGFLYFKGALSLLKPIVMPTPMFIMGNAADVISAAILMTGDPAILADYKYWIAGFLGFKGLWGLSANF